MYKITIDVGNTFVKIATFFEDSLVKQEKFTTLTKENLSEFLKNFPAKELKKAKAIISSVRHLEQDVLQMVYSFLDLMILDSTTLIPINNHYQTPQTLGNDRLAAVIGASKLFPNENILVIDAGTCITWDFIDKAKNYLGGGIAPGIKMRLEAVHTFTSKLPLVDMKKAENLLGKSTVDSIKAGCVNVSVLEVEAIINEFKKDYSDLKIILCGGDAIFLQKEIKSNTFAPLNLIFIGLKEILDFNENK